MLKRAECFGSLKAALSSTGSARGYLLVLLTLFVVLVISFTNQIEAGSDTTASFLPKPGDYDIYSDILPRYHLASGWQMRALENSVEKPNEDAGTAAKWWTQDFDDSNWSKQYVPWNWNYTFDEKIDRQFFNGVAWYRLRFKVPERFSGSPPSAYLHFEGVGSEATVWLNGKLLGKHTDFGKPGETICGFVQKFEFDVTDVLKRTGDNVLAVRVFHNDPEESSPLNRGGIWAPVWIDFREEVYASHISVASHINKSELEVDATFVNTETSPQGLPLTCIVRPWNKRKGFTTQVKVGTFTLAPGETTRSFAVKLKNPIQWSTETPFLYLLELRSGPNLLGCVRFGFREVTWNEKFFYLNGKRIFLRGHVGGRTETGPFLLYNGPGLKQLLRVYKQANLNHLRIHGGWSLCSPIFYDLADEEGILICDELYFDKVIFEEARRAEEIDKGSPDFVSLVFAPGEKVLRPEYERLVQERLGALATHPSVAMWSFGNEVRAHDTPASVPYNDSLYTLYKQWDSQCRPITRGSGRYFSTAGLVNRADDKGDYWDTHDYTGTESGTPYTFCEDSIRSFVRDMTQIFGKRRPVINGECSGGFRAWGSQYGPVVSGMLDPANHIHEYIKFTALTRQELGDIYHYGWYNVRDHGIRAYAQEHGKSVSQNARNQRRVLGTYRRLRDELAGYESLGTIVNDRGNPAYYYDALREVNRPLTVLSDLFDRNVFEGGEVHANLCVINDYLDPRNELSVIARLRAEDGSFTFWEDGIHVGKLDAGAHTNVQWSHPVGEDRHTGNYLLTFTLYEDDRQVACDSWQIHILSASEGSLPITTSRRVALYDLKGTTAEVLKDLNIAVNRLTDFNDLDGFDILVLGTDSIDSKVLLAGKRIRSWIEAGGRMLALEQSYVGPLPWLTEAQLADAGSPVFVDMIRPDHPILRGFTVRNWDTWNGGDHHTMFSRYILPMSESVIAAGGDTKGGPGPEKFGMVIAEVAMQNGVCFLSQALAVSRWKTDSVATRYVRSVFQYTLEKSWPTSHARVMQGE